MGFPRQPSYTKWCLFYLAGWTAFGPCCSSPNGVGERRKRPLGAVKGRGSQARIQPRGGRPARPGSRTRCRRGRSVTWRRHFRCPCFALKAAAVLPPSLRTERLRTGDASPSAPTAHCPPERRGGCGGGRGTASAKISPRLIKRWGPVPAPYKYARRATGGLWPARLGSALQAGRCRQHSRAPLPPPPLPGQPRTPAPQRDAPGRRRPQTGL